MVRNPRGDVVYWQVRWKPPGQKAKRRFFKNQYEAIQERLSLTNQFKEHGNSWMVLEDTDRREIMSCIDYARQLKITFREALDFYKTRGGSASSITAGRAFEKFMEEKRGHGNRLSKQTLDAYECNIGRFIEGREETKLDAITREEFKEWLNRPEWSASTYNTYLTCASIFFNWCVKCEFLIKSPISSISKINKKQMPNYDQPPSILTVDQCRSLLQACIKEDRRLIGYVVVGLFGGLRPQKESGALLRPDIGETDIMVRANNAKDRQRRHVEINPTLKSWLTFRSEFPPKMLRARFERVRAASGLIKIDKVEGKEKHQITWTGWDADCLRHTFASYYIAIHGAEKTIAQLGHGDYSMVFSHYRQLVTRSEAEKFWALTAEAVCPEALIAYDHKYEKSESEHETQKLPQDHDGNWPIEADFQIPKH